MIIEDYISFETAKLLREKGKELLLKDLSARLSYKVHCCVLNLNKTIKEENDIIYGIVGDNIVTLKSNKNECYVYYQIKPYLRPMSEIANLINAKEFTQLSGIDLIDWYNANYIDYRTDKEGKTMIPKGLALKAPEGMYH